jgi:polysaccharide chain length determinant protein (PEP-CTERM system associated)
MSVPRRSFDFEDYIDILRRNFRWIIGPAFLGLVLATVFAYTMDDTFISRALIRIVPQQVPENLVQTAVNQQLVDRINAMAETIESRNSLQNVITTYGLYKKELKSEPLDDVIQLMQRNIKIQPTEGVTNVNGHNLPAFQLSFVYKDRYLAQRVCAELVSRFLNENAKTRLESAVATNQFLNDEYAKAKAVLESIETKLTEFRIRNAGHLPEEMQMNMSQMNALDTRLTGLNDSMNRVTQQKMMLDSQLQIAKDRLAAFHQATPENLGRDAHLEDLDRQIAAATTSLASLHERYTATYPDVTNAETELAQLKRQREQVLQEMKNRKPDSAHSNLPPSRERMDAEAIIQQIQTQLRAKDLEAAAYTKEIATVNQSIKQYQGRVESVPVGEKEYNDLIRDRDLAKQRYQELQMKLSSSAISMEMENRKQGETLEVLDQASLPDTPTAPKRQLIIPIGLFAGVFLGFILVAIREVKDNSLKTLKDARLYTQMVILGSVPLLENDLVIQRRRQLAWLGWATAALAGLGIMAISVAHYYLGKV